MKKYFVTTPIYYMNGTPHLGHYYATTLADMFARYYRSTDRGAFFLTGTDEHGQKVADKAISLGKDPQEFVDEVAGQWQALWDQLDLSYDFFVRTSSPDHKAFAQFVITQLKNNGAVYEKEYDALYCVGAESFVTKSELREGGLCPDHDEEPQIIHEKNWFFKLSEYKDQIRELMQQDVIEIVPQARKNETLELLKNDSFTDFSVTRENVSWGIQVPFAPKQTIYVWIDALFNYMSAVVTAQSVDIQNATVAEILEAIQDTWQPDVHIIGKDILKFHAVYWPAFLLALGVPVEQLPKRLLVTGMFVSEGRKMSKSLGNTILPQDIIAEYTPIVGQHRANDILRYYVISEMKVGNDGDITPERVREVYSSDLVNKIGNTYSRVVGMARKYDLLDTRMSPEKHTKLQTVIQSKIRERMEASDLHAVSGYLLDLMNEIGRGIETVKPWELAKAGNTDQLTEHIAKWLTVLEILADAWEPIMPTTSQEMKQLLAGEQVMLFPRLQ